jgi:dihydroxy-acid dehydratase
VSETVLSERRAAQLARGKAAYTPATRDRHVSPALQAYAALTTSAAKGAVRDVGQLKR